MRGVRLGYLRMRRAEVAREPQVDARDDELTIAVGDEHDGWVVSQFEFRLIKNPINNPIGTHAHHRDFQNWNA